MATSVGPWMVRQADEDLIMTKHVDGYNQVCTEGGPGGRRPLGLGCDGLPLLYDDRF
jgi:hypothetical protein